MFKNCLDAEKEFEKCWQNPKYTAIQLNDVDINKILTYYTLQNPLHFTLTMLWDMEKKKAWNPARYISYVIKEGSTKSRDKHLCPETGGELFVRCSAQKKWLEPKAYEEIFEEVYVNDNAKCVTFLGVTTLPGEEKIINPTQPLFHVQHGAEGTEEKPLNTWRIVHLTSKKDQQLINHFKDARNPTDLPGYIEAYIKNDLNILIRKK